MAEMYYGASPLIRKRAKDLRNRRTQAELILWEEIRGKKLGCKFRQQHPLANYIADFYCHELKLVIEVDGKSHNSNEVRAWDKARNEYMEDLGITVIRVQNRDVHRSIEKVISKIKKIISKIRTHKSPS